MITMKIITKEQFFTIIRDGKDYESLKSADEDDLHYLQLIFFKPYFAVVSAVLFLGLGVIPVIFINLLWLRLLILGLALWADYHNRHMLKGCFKGMCLYEVLSGK